MTLFSFFSSNYDERKMKSSEHNLYNSVMNTTAPASGRFYEPRPTYRSTEVDDVTIYLGHFLVHWRNLWPNGI